MMIFPIESVDLNMTNESAYPSVPIEDIWRDEYFDGRDCGFAFEAKS